MILNRPTVYWQDEGMARNPKYQLPYIRRNNFQQREGYQKVNIETTSRNKGGNSQIKA